MSRRRSLRLLSATALAAAAGIATTCSAADPTPAPLSIHCTANRPMQIQADIIGAGGVILWSTVLAPGTCGEPAQAGTGAFAVALQRVPAGSKNAVTVQGTASAQTSVPIAVPGGGTGESPVAFHLALAPTRLQPGRAATFALRAEPGATVDAGAAPSLTLTARPAR